jgi:hypothetical protein
MGPKLLESAWTCSIRNSVAWVRPGIETERVGICFELFAGFDGLF